MMYIREVGVRCPVTISPLASTDHAIELMWRHDIRHLLVTEHGRLVGLLSDAELLESVGMLLRAERLTLATSVSQEEVIVADVMDSRCPALPPEEQMTDVAQHLIEERRGALPVVDDGQILGVVTVEDVLQLFAGSCWLEKESPQRRQVAPYASPISRTVTADDTLATAAAKLCGTRFRHLPVLEDQLFAGLLSDWDVRFAIHDGEHGDWKPRRVRDCMTTGVQTLRPNDTLACAAEVMRLDGLTSVPITSRDGELLSVITAIDLLRATAAPALAHVSH